MESTYSTQSVVWNAVPNSGFSSYRLPQDTANSLAVKMCEVFGNCFVGCRNDTIRRSRNPGSLRRFRGTNGVAVTGTASGTSLLLHLGVVWCVCVSVCV